MTDFSCALTEAQINRYVQLTQDQCRRHLTDLEKVQLCIYSSVANGLGGNGYAKPSEKVVIREFGYVPYKGTLADAMTVDGQLVEIKSSFGADLRDVGKSLDAGVDIYIFAAVNVTGITLYRLTMADIEKYKFREGGHQRYWSVRRSDVVKNFTPVKTITFDL